MSRREIIRAWKDEDYRNSLDQAQRTHLPEFPVGLIELPDEELDHVAAGIQTINWTCFCGPTIGCCIRPE